VTVDRPRLGFIGAGIVGTALARSLLRAGYSVAAIASRSADRCVALAKQIPGAHAASTPQEVADAADLVLLTVPDDSIEPLCGSITWASANAIEPPAGSITRASARAVHCSGATSLDVLEHARAQGADVGVFHPLQTFANAAQAERNLPGSTFGIEASSDKLLGTLREMAASLGGTPLVLSGDRAIYHVSAVIACNYLVTLLDTAAGLWEGLGLTKDEGLRALLPLVRGTIENLESVGLPNALTGPIARGDLGTIERHLSALGKVAPDVLPVYKELARKAIPIARAKGGLSEEASDRLLAILDRTDGGGKQR
jgi:predicted short-subunit dehydrogenase-like oxidoreductase (DUF2520 family)